MRNPSPREIPFAAEPAAAGGTTIRGTHRDTAIRRWLPRRGIAASGEPFTANGSTVAERTHRGEIPAIGRNPRQWVKPPLDFRVTLSPGMNNAAPPGGVFFRRAICPPRYSPAGEYRRCASSSSCKTEARAPFSLPLRREFRFSRGEEKSEGLLPRFSPRYAVSGGKARHLPSQKRRPRRRFPIRAPSRVISRKSRARRTEFYGLDSRCEFRSVRPAIGKTHLLREHRTCALVGRLTVAEWSERQEGETRGIGALALFPRDLAVFVLHFVLHGGEPLPRAKGFARAVRSGEALPRTGL